MRRLAAIRYMELHGYLDHGFRVLSHPTGETTPEIVQHAEKVDLPGLKADRVVELKLDGRKDEELYRMLLVAQCNALHTAMPFLFERIDDETELLLPDNLLHSDSVIRQLVDRIPEGDWQEIEIIGWLYQFYISEKKDQVIGKVVKSEDIPAATQLFTPNWIVKYMVQNSLGAKWLATYPDSPIRAKMEYYIEPAEQSEEVRKHVADETPGSLDPEDLTFLDPATGSGHILVEAYDLFKDIYLERGYRLRDIPRLILEKNLHGLDIDDRAAQLSGFALLMRARADDRRILATDDPVKLRVLAIQESDGLNATEIVNALFPQHPGDEVFPSGDLLPDTLAQPTLSGSERSNKEGKTVLALLDLFTAARTYGSLIDVPEKLSVDIAALRERVRQFDGGDLIEDTERRYLVERLLPVIQQAEVLGSRYDIVAANPPYMGSKGMNPILKAFASRNYPDSKSDLFAMFMERALRFTSTGGAMAMINMQSWMFLSSYQRLREKLLSNSAILSMAHLGERAFDSIGGAVVSTTAFVIANAPHPHYRGTFIRLVDGGSEAEKITQFRRATRESSNGSTYEASSERFEQIPGCPIAYWMTDASYQAFAVGTPLSEYSKGSTGLQTSNSDRFLRLVGEVDASSIGERWLPFSKGGSYRRWFGNTEHVVRWDDNGRDIKRYVSERYPYLKGNYALVVKNESTYFSEGLLTSRVTTGPLSFRYKSKGEMYADACTAIFPDDTLWFLALLNSRPLVLVRALNPTMNFQASDIEKFPVIAVDDGSVERNAMDAINLAKADWNSYETALEFGSSPLLELDVKHGTLFATYENLRSLWRDRTRDLMRIEEENNRLFIDAYGLQNELSHEVEIEEITLSCNPAYRYGAEVSETEQESLLLGDTMREFISYGVGCALGRYSLDKPGLILANQSDTLADYLAKVPSPTFAIDSDNILPMLDDSWFEDDVADRFLDFLKVAFGNEHFEENLAFIENAIGKDIRKFFKRDFFSDHLKRYKRRPIYWVFSSGKEKAFEAIVYMHRYNETTLARMRMNYVVPLQSQMASRIERLATELSGANLSSAERKRKDTQRAKLIKQLEELGRFEEELRHLADQRIRIDLDDGVKVNYGKFGNLLAEVKAVTGGGDE